MLFYDNGSNADVIWHQIRCRLCMGNERKNVMWYILRRNYFKEMGNTTDI
jgi:hypothetical protein